MLNFGFIVFFLSYLAFAVSALVSVLRSSVVGSTKFAWVVAVWMLPIIGGIIWFTFGRKSVQRKFV
jgi:Phospholipase_D-nuclease N-terminal